MVSIRTLPLAVGVTALAVAPATASAAAKPAVKTGLAGSITPQSVTLTGTVDPNGGSTRYAFEYGTTAKLGKRTAWTSAGAGTDPVAAVAGVSGLKSATTYRYRVVARNAKGVVRGAQRTFKTKVQPLGFAVAANPAQVPFAGTTLIAGTLGGTGSVGRQVRLEQNPWPYAGWTPIGNVLLTDKQGGFVFPVTGLGINTQYRVSTTNKNPTVSPVVQTTVLVDVQGGPSTHRVRRNRTVRVSGKIHPAKPGAEVRIQRESSSGKWRTSAVTQTVAGGTTYSSYATRIRVYKSSRYRVLVKVADGSLAENAGTPFRISARSR